MALQKQPNAAPGTRVGRDFPVLPKPPTLTISQDNQAIQQYHAGLEQWYHQHKAAIQRDLETLAQQIQTLQQNASKASTTPTSTTHK